MSFHQTHTSPQVRRGQLLRTKMLALAAVLAISSLPSVASAQGSWSPVHDWSSSLVSGCKGFDELSHAAVIPIGLYKGQVLLWHCEAGPTDSTSAWIVDPASPSTIAKVDTPVAANLFCSGMSWDSQGRLLIAGGIGLLSGSLYNGIYRFDPAVLSTLVPGNPPIITTTSNPWTQLTDMGLNRYYPALIALNRRRLTTCSTVVGGQHIVLGGPDLNQAVLGNEFWELVPHPTSTACVLTPPVPIHSHTGNPDPYTLNNSPDILLDSYPRVFQLSNDEVFIASDVDTGNYSTPPNPPNNPLPPNRPGQSWVIKPNYGTGTAWELWDGPDADAGGRTNDRNYGTAVLMHQLGALNRILVFGGAQDINWPNGPTVYAVNRTTQEFSLGTSASATGGVWYTHLLSPITPSARNNLNGVILPTGDVLIEGGAYRTRPASAADIAFSPVLYTPGVVGSPGSAVMLSAAPNVSGFVTSTPRLYHHLTVLLTDGRVFVAGGESLSISGQPPFPPSDFNGQIFDPPYPSYRPTITQYPSTTTFYKETLQQFQMQVTTVQGPISHVVLLRPAALTHHFDSDQRYIELSFTATLTAPNTYTLTVTRPTDNLGAAGYYMLWVVEDGPLGRAPSTKSEFIQIL
jgi:hypothetical protein